jgi:4-alpha-glucanotransferase
MIPEKLRESGYRLFIDTLRANCPPDGILRLDHVMGMFRLFCIPAGAGADQGTYIYYPAREFLAILALESVRRRTLIIGEDLGTVAPRVRKELARQGMYSYKVFYFERTPTGACRPPGDYPRQALATITTHDLPTLAGYWEGRDMEVKERLHLYQYPGQAAADAAARPAERERFVQALAGEGLIPPGREPHLKAARRCPEAVRLGVAQFLGKSQAALVEIRLEEVLGVRFQQNLPGTIREHPNWRWKLPALLEDLAQMPQPRRLAQIMGERKWEAGEGPGR